MLLSLYGNIPPSIHILADNATGLINTLKQAMLDGGTVAELHKANIMSPYSSQKSDIVSLLAPPLDQELIFLSNYQCTDDEECL